MLGSREQSNAAVGATGEEPGLCGVELAGEDTQVRHDVMTSKNLDRNDERVLVQVTERGSAVH